MRKSAVFIKNSNHLIPLAVIFVLFAVFVPSLPVFAAPVVTLVPSSGAVGTTVTISGTVFDSYEGDNIHIFFDTAEIENSPIVVPPEGSFSVNFAIPASAVPGKHTIGVKRETTDSSMIISSTFTVDATAITPDIAEGIVGALVNVSGSGFYVNKPVTLSYLNVAQETLGTATASSNGKFAFQFVVPISAAGFHQITASNDVGNQAVISFKVLPELKMNLDSAGSGDPVNASGAGFAALSRVDIIFGSLSVASALTDAYGSFEIDFNVPAIKPSSYNVRAQDTQGNTDQATFTITAGASLSESTGAAGSELTINGSGFTPGQTVTVYYDDIPVAVAVADNNGDFTATFTVPAGGGKHLITVSDGATIKKYSFSLETEPPPVPALLLPLNESLTKAEAYFDWQDVTDVSLPVTYQLQIAADRNFASVVLLKTDIGDSQYTLTENEVLAAEFKNAPYYWRVKAVDGAGNESEWADPLVCFVSVPPTPVLLLPAADAQIGLPIHFRWQSTASLSPPVKYSLQIAANPDFAAAILNKTGIAVPEYLISEEDDARLDKNTTYFWRVKAVDNAFNSSDWSATGTFVFIATAGFPGWATYTLISIGGLIAVLLAFRAGRRTAYH